LRGQKPEYRQQAKNKTSNIQLRTFNKKSEGQIRITEIQNKKQKPTTNYTKMHELFNR